MAEGYVTPQVRVFQQATRVPAFTERRLPAHVSGGHAFLLRYSDPDEQPRGELGYYDGLIDQEFAWPDRPAGALVDQDYAKLFVRDALLQYLHDSSAGGSSVTKVTGYNNRIRAAALAFKENGEDFPRSASLYDRDVAPGDVVKVRGVNGASEAVTLWTSVKSILPDVVPADVAAATADDSNAATAGSAVATVTKLDTIENCVGATADATDYEGRPSGYVTETYDVIVTESSVGGDHTLARVRVISGSGTDDVEDVTPAEFGTAFAVGTRGLTWTFTDADSAACSASATAGDIGADDLIAGQRWRVAVTQLFTAPVATGAGDYEVAEGADFDRESTTYVITVTKGGVYADEPQITVSTTTGTDSSGPTTVTAAATDVAVGTRGLTVSFEGTGLRKGDRYYIEVTGASDGYYRTLVLSHSLDTTISTSAELDLTLFIRKPVLQVSENRTGFAPEVNFETSATEFTVKSGITVYEDSWTDGGTPLPLDLVSEESKGYGLMFVEYRAWLSTWVETLDSVTTEDLDSKISGAIHPDNPLKYGCFKALENSNGTPVKFSAIADPSQVEDWAAMLEVLVGQDGVYGLVPLTRERAVLDLFIAHITSMSNEDNNLWRVGWFNLEGLASVPIVHAGSSVSGHVEASTSDGEVALCVVSDDPLTTGTQYTLLRCTSDNANFTTLGVRAGDEIRIQYTTDGFGNTAWSSFTVDDVLSEDELRLAAGPTGPISSATKTEVWRTLTATEEATAIGVVAGAFANRRIMAIWPDTVEVSGTIVPGYFLCAAYAGYASGVLPHQGLTHAAISGFTSTPRTNLKFNRTHRDIMSNAGVWVVEQDLTGLSAGLGEIYARHAITTVGYQDQTQREEAITRNVDSISFRFRDWFRPYIGRVNVVPTMRARLEVEANALVETLKTEADTPDLGGQLLDGTTVSVRKHALARDRFLIDLDAVLPYALNNIDVTISF